MRDQTVTRRRSVRFAIRRSVRPSAHRPRSPTSAVSRGVPTTAWNVVAAVVALGFALPVSAQSGGEVLRTAVDRYEERMEGVENYTVAQEAMGFQAEIYYERQEVDGRSVFVPRLTGGSAAMQGAPESPYAELGALADRAEHRGTEVVNGAESHVVTVDDFQGVDIWNPTGGGASGDFTPERATFYIDTGDHLIRRMEMRGSTSMQGREGEVSFTADFQDYREVEGMLHPFMVQVTVDGVADQMSPEERRRLQESLEEMRARMEEMPEEQRRMMEQMMQGQLEQMEAMLSGGTMDLTVEVTEIRVNEGPPESDPRE